MVSVLRRKKGCPAFHDTAFQVTKICKVDLLALRANAMEVLQNLQNSNIVNVYLGEILTLLSFGCQVVCSLFHQSQSPGELHMNLKDLENH